jgi:aarF domain-containing kinase
MRGAALKLGQFMSIQDSGALPPELEKVLRRVQAGADYMPDWQMQVRASTLFNRYPNPFPSLTPTSRF